MDKKKILFFYNNFYPAWKAGGPVQSLTNLAYALSGKISISVICSGYELDEMKSQLSEIKLSHWNNIIGTQTYYLNKNEHTFKKIKMLISESSADTIYLNGLFSLPFVVYPLLVWKIYFTKQKKLILSPRGMLQEGALKVKPFKKTLFVNGLKLLGLFQNISWHATDIQEAEDIRRHFGNNSCISIAPNIPKRPIDILKPIEKKAAGLRLVYLSLIVAKKNLHLALQLIKDLGLPLTFDIYGPVKDKKYWNDCLVLIESMPSDISVKYMGDVKPALVQGVFSNYHALFLPTNGENFGHAIYECLSVGRPVIISDTTPWRDLEKQHAGFDIAVNNRRNYKEAITSLYNMDHSRYEKLCECAYNLASEYWNNNDFESAYMKMFN